MQLLPIKNVAILKFPNFCDEFENIAHLLPIIEENGKLKGTWCLTTFFSHVECMLSFTNVQKFGVNFLFKEILLFSNDALN